MAVLIDNGETISKRPRVSSHGRRTFLSALRVVAIVYYAIDSRVALNNDRPEQSEDDSEFHSCEI